MIDGILIAGPEVGTNLVPKRDAAVCKLEQALRVAFEVGDRVVLVVDKDLPTVAIAAVGFASVPVMREEAIDVADVAAEKAVSALAPDAELLFESVCRVGVDGSLDFTDEAEGHVMVGGAEDTKVDQTAYGIEGGTASGPGVARVSESTLGSDAIDGGLGGLGLVGDLIAIGIEEPGLLGADGLKFGPNVLAMGEHLNYVVVLKLLDGFVGPIGADEGDVGIDPGEVFRGGVLGEDVREEEIERIFFVPDLMRGTQLEVAFVAGFGDGEGPVTVSDFDGPVLHMGAFNLRFKGLKQLVASRIADRVRNDGADVECGLAPGQPLNQGPRKIRRSRLVLHSFLGRDGGPLADCSFAGEGEKVCL